MSFMLSFLDCGPSAVSLTGGAGIQSSVDTNCFRPFDLVDPPLSAQHSRMCYTVKAE